MNTTYIEYTIQADEMQQEWIAALLDEMGYEGFVQEANEIIVYILEAQKDENALKEILVNGGHSGVYMSQTILPKNWNEEWESGFKPVDIAGKIYVRATFHEPKPDYIYDILVQPKMSFGTGHHDTTASVMELMLDLDFKGKQVFDYGCGTAILSVLASKLGAASVFCNDIDDWIEENVAENLELNQVSNVQYKMGDISLVKGKQFDIILANINRNVLLESFGSMDQALKPSGMVIISGFFQEDVEVLLEALKPYHWELKRQIATPRNWTAILFEKTNK